MSLPTPRHCSTYRMRRTFTLRPFLRHWRIVALLIGGFLVGRWDYADELEREAAFRKLSEQQYAALMRDVSERRVKLIVEGERGDVAEIAGAVHTHGAINKW